MCGRARLPEDYSEIKIDLKLHEVVPHTYTPLWNVPPAEMLPVITSRMASGALSRCDGA
jgi:hypothetical protein